MNKNYLFSFFLLMSFIANAQLVTTTYRGAFAPAPANMWTDAWTNFDPQNAVYSDPTTATVVDAPTTVVYTNTSVTPNVTTTSKVGEITTNTTWTTGNSYFLKGQIYVKNGATLTIQPGVTVFFDHTATGAGLFITRGSKINAVGTATQPIVFTSDKAVGSRATGDWGGIILLGKGKYNINNGFNNVEGLSQTPDTKFGADTTLGEVADPADNSGTLKYVRIEYAGYIYAPNQEINGLTFGAVGSGTTVDNVQVSFANDDSFEWFGGSVNCTHLVAYRGLDDDWDTDNGFSGTVQFCLGIRDPQISDNPAVSTSNGFESDNNSTSVDGTSFTTCVFSNVTEIGPHYRQLLPQGGVLASGFGRMAHLRRNSRQTIVNCVLLDYNNGIHIDGYVTPAGSTSNTELNCSNDLLKYKNNILLNSTQPIYVNTPPSGTPNNNVPLLNVTTWYSSNGNTNPGSPLPKVAPNTILVKPYDETNAKIYTGLDYRPVVGGGADTGAVFSSLSVTNFNVLDQVNVFKVYPNAFSSTFKLSFTTTSSEDATVSVFNTQGQLVETRTIAASQLEDAAFGSSYASGVYLVTIKQGTVSNTVRALKK